MADLAFVVRLPASGAPAARLWGSLVRGSGSAWPLLGEANRIEVNAPVLFDLPHPRGGSVRSSGRIVEIIPGRSLVLRQETPWVGQVRMDLLPTEDGTNVRVFVSMEDTAVEWLLREEVAETPLEELRPLRPSQQEVRIGLLVSLSGISNIMGRSIVNGASLAVQELRAEGVFGRRHIQMLVEDDRMDPAAALSAYRRLVLDGCNVVIMSVSSSSLAAIRPAATRQRHLVLNTALSERGRIQSANFFDLGESPAEQLVGSIPRLMADKGTLRWYLVGNDYVWPRAMAAVARREILNHHGKTVGESYKAIGTRTFDDLLDAVVASGADAVLSSFVGEDEVRFESAVHSRGLRRSFQTLATNFDASLLEHLGVEKARGIWTTNDFPAFGMAAADTEFSERYYERFSRTAAPVTGMGKAAYNGIHLFASAAHRASSLAPDDVAAEIRRARGGPESMRKRIQGELSPALTAEVTATGFAPIQ